MPLVESQGYVSPRSPARPAARRSDDTNTTRLPTQDELPYSDGDKLESERHVLGMQLLITTLKPWLRRRHEETGEGGYVGGDMFLYFSPEQVKNRHFRGPDVLVVLGVEPGERKSWVAWHEGKGPDLVIELLSESTRKTDKQVKPRVYRDEAGVREYYWFDPFNPQDFAGFAFRGDPRAVSRPHPGLNSCPDDPPENRSQENRAAGESAALESAPLPPDTLPPDTLPPDTLPPDTPPPDTLPPDTLPPDLASPNLAPDDSGQITSAVLGLRLGTWKGCYEGVDAVWLRWYTPEGELLLPEDAERAELQARRAELQARRADESDQRAEQQARRAEQQAHRAEQQARRAELAEKRADEQARLADQLASKLRELGFDPDQHSG